jgi:hypothetical protein
MANRGPVLHAVLFHPHEREEVRLLPVVWLNAGRARRHADATRIIELEVAKDVVALRVLVIFAAGVEALRLGDGERIVGINPKFLRRVTNERGATGGRVREIAAARKRVRSQLVELGRVEGAAPTPFPGPYAESFDTNRHGPGRAGAPLAHARIACFGESSLASFLAALVSETSKVWNAKIVGPEPIYEARKGEESRGDGGTEPRDAPQWTNAARAIPASETIGGP